MQELRVCVYNVGGGDRVGSVIGNTVYDLNLCCAQQMAEDRRSLDSYRLANSVVPPTLGDFIEGGSNTLEAARQALAWALKAGGDEGPAGRPCTTTRIRWS